MAIDPSPDELKDLKTNKKVLFSKELCLRR